MINNIENKINKIKIMATRDTKENYNAYMRDYYKKNNQNKTTRINNKIDEIVMAIFNAPESKLQRRDIIKSLVELKQMAKLPKMEFTVPDEIVDFLNTCVSMKKKILPVRLAYAIKKNMAAVQEAASAYTAEREELIRRYAKKDENGEIMTEDDCYVMEDKERFGKDMSELLNIETEVEIHTVSISVVEKCDEDAKYDPLTMAELDVIDFMLTE